MVAYQTVFDDRQIDDSYLSSSNQGATFGLATTVQQGRVGGRGSQYYHAWWHVSDLFGTHDNSGTTLGATATITSAYFEVILSSVTNDLADELGGFDGKVFNAPTGCTAMGHYVEETVTWCAGSTCYNSVGGCVASVFPSGGNVCLDCRKWTGGPGHIDHPVGNEDTWNYDASLSAGATMQIPCTNCVQFAVDDATASGELHLFAEDGQVNDTQRYVWHSVQATTTTNRPILVVNWDDGAPIPPTPITATNFPKFVLSHDATIIASAAISSSADMAITTSADLKSTTEIVGNPATIVLATSADLSSKNAVSAEASMALSTSAEPTATGSISSTAPIVLSTTSDIQANANLSSSAGMVLSSSAELLSTINVDADAPIVLSTTAEISATGSISGDTPIVLSGSAAQSAIGSISSTAPMVLSTSATLTHVSSVTSINAVASMAFSSSSALTNSTPITELAGSASISLSTSLSNIVSLFDAQPISLVLSVDNALIRDSESIKALASVAPIVLFAGKGQGGTGPSLRDSFRWLTASTEPTAGVELCPYTPFTLRTKFDTLLGGITFGDKFEDLKAAGLTVGWQSGVISGIPTEMDTYVGLFAIPEGQQVDEQSYATYGSAGLFDATGNSIPHGITFIGQATLHDPIVAPDATYLAIELPLTIEREFFIPIHNNWSSDRDQLALTLNTPNHQTYFGGKQVTPTEFLAAEKAQGYYGNVCVPVTMPKGGTRAIALNTSGDLTDPSAHAASINNIEMSSSATLHDSNPVGTL